MNAVIDRIADLADIDTRRAMGYDPRKLSDIWRDFTPKTIDCIDYKYYIDENKLVYFEFPVYDEMYSEIITHVTIIDRVRPLFFIHPNSVTRTITHTNTHTRWSEEISHTGHLTTAGIPIYVVRNPVPRNL